LISIRSSASTANVSGLLWLREHGDFSPFIRPSHYLQGCQFMTSSVGFFYHTQSRYGSTVLDIDPGFSFDCRRKQSFRLEEIRRFLCFRPAIIISTRSSPHSSSPAFTASFGVGHHSVPSILARQGPTEGIRQRRSDAHERLRTVSSLPWISRYHCDSRGSVNLRFGENPPTPVS
jgi:hypothetical protein